MPCYDAHVIRSFRDKATRKFFLTGKSRQFTNMRTTGRTKLGFLQNANSLLDLQDPPGNKLEALKGDRAGQYSIRINDQYRLCFVWRENEAWDVEIVDYH